MVYNSVPCTLLVIPAKSARELGKKSESVRWRSEFRTVNKILSLI